MLNAENGILHNCSREQAEKKEDPSKVCGLCKALRIIVNALEAKGKSFDELPKESKNSQKKYESWLYYPAIFLDGFANCGRGSLSDLLSFFKKILCDLQADEKAWEEFKKSLIEANKGKLSEEDFKSVGNSSLNPVLWEIGFMVSGGN